MHRKLNRRPAETANGDPGGADRDQTDGPLDGRAVGIGPSDTNADPVDRVLKQTFDPVLREPVPERLYDALLEARRRLGLDTSGRGPGDDKDTGGGNGGGKTDSAD
jgi:hypothetical protein